MATRSGRSRPSQHASELWDRVNICRAIACSLRDRASDAYTYCLVCPRGRVRFVQIAQNKSCSSSQVQDTYVRLSYSIDRNIYMCSAFQLSNSSPARPDTSYCHSALSLSLSPAARARMYVCMFYLSPDVVDDTVAAVASASSVPSNLLCTGGRVLPPGGPRRL